MTTSWAMSSNADADDDFFSTIAKPDSIWNNDNTSLLAEIDSIEVTQQLPPLDEDFMDDDFNNDSREDFNNLESESVRMIDNMLAPPLITSAAMMTPTPTSTHTPTHTPIVTTSSDSSISNISRRTVTTNSNSNSNSMNNNVFDTQATKLGNNHEVENTYNNQNQITSSNSIITSSLSSSVSRSDIEHQNNNSDNNDIYDIGQEENDYQDNTETIDTILAKELNSLSFQQRESINEEIHGLNVDRKEIEETPQLLKESFVKLQIELNQLQPDSFAYNRCQQLYGNDDKIALNHGVLGNTKGRRTYINTDNFRMIFLRCQLFNIVKAARRLVSFVELMFKLYGDIGIQRRIRLEDLSDFELRFIKAGSMQFLPGRDRAGRRIFLQVAHNSTNEYTEKSRLRIMFYMHMSLADDIETQRKGCVYILWYHNVNMFHDYSIKQKTHSAISKCALVRMAAVHVCIPEELGDDNFTNIPALSSDDDNSDSTVTTTSLLRSATPANVIKSMIALSIGTKGRKYLRIHSGSALECLYALQSFGIPSSQIPIDIGISSYKMRKRKKTKINNKTNLKLENHIKWLNLCQLKDSNIKSCGKKWKKYDENHHNYDGHQQIIECPKHSDVLFGRGRDMMNHPGNMVLRSIVESKFDEYIKLKSHNDIIKFTLNVVHVLKNKYGARFLKEETIESNGKLGCWIEVSEKAARTKVRVSFRDKNKPQQSQQKTKPTTTATTTTMSMTTTDDNYNTTNNNNKNQQIHQYQHVDNEDSNSSTSMFLSMTGGNNSSGCGCGCGCGCGSTSTEKKSQRRKKSCFR